jgi:hypothetical protein
MDTEDEGEGGEHIGNKVNARMKVLEEMSRTLTLLVLFVIN